MPHRIGKNVVTEISVITQDLFGAASIVIAHNTQGLSTQDPKSSRTQDMWLACCMRDAFIAYPIIVLVLPLRVQNGDVVCVFMRMMSSAQFPWF